MTTAPDRGSPSSRQKPGELSGSEVARLGDIGVKLERLAEGEVTERREIGVRTYERVMMPVLVLIKKTIDVVVTDADERQRLVNVLAPAIDRIRDEHLSDLLSQRDE